MIAGSERRTCWLVAAVLVAVAQPAFAQPSRTSVAATAEFDKGRSLMKAKQFDEACAAFERSHKLDAQAGTLYNLASCYVEIGKLATAWATFRDLAGSDPNQARRKAAGKQATALAKRMPKLVVRADDVPSGLVLKVDGIDVTNLIGTDTPIDLGKHEIEATAPNFERFTKTVKVKEEAKTISVEVELVPTQKSGDRGRDVPTRRPPPREDPVRDPADPDAGNLGVTSDPPVKSTRRRTAIIVGVSGGAMLAMGGAFAAFANGKWAEARDLCGEDLMCSSTSQLEEGNALVNAAKLRAHVSTGFVIGGVAMVSAAVYLMMTPKRDTATKRALRITPTAGSAHVGLSLEGGF